MRIKRIAMQLSALFWLAVTFTMPAMAEGASQNASDLPSLGVVVTATPRPLADAEEDVVLPEALQEATPAEAEPQIEGFTRLLVRGLEGEDVRHVQQRLIDLGYLLDEPDGVYGRRTAAAVADFQAAHGLAKVDGKAGEETIARLFSADVIAKPTPEPTPSPTPRPTPSPAPTPTPSPVPTPAPDARQAPFAAAEREVFLREEKATLLLGAAPEGTLYPIGGVLLPMGYDAIHADGVWELTGPDGTRLTIMAAQEDGLCGTALGAVNDALFLPDGPIYVFGDDLWTTADTLSQLGLHVVETGETAVIW